MEFIFFRAAQKVLLFWFVLKAILNNTILSTPATGECSAKAFSVSHPPCAFKWVGSGWTSACKGTQMAQLTQVDKEMPHGAQQEQFQEGGRRGICAPKPVLGVLLLGDTRHLLAQGNPLFCCACMCSFFFSGQTVCASNHESSPSPCVSFLLGRRGEWGSDSVVWLMVETTHHTVNLVDLLSCS